jgi:excisionase family DNA binding protein
MSHTKGGAGPLPLLIDAEALPSRGQTPAEVARRLRVSRGRILAWIRSGELSAINTASARLRRPRYVILPEHLRAFTAARQVSPPPKSPPRRRRRSEEIDYYPEY